MPSFLDPWTGWSADWRGWRPPLVDVLQNYLVCVITRMLKLILESKHDVKKSLPSFVTCFPCISFFFFLGILEVLHCVLVESPEALNVIKESHIKSIISLLDKHGRNHKVMHSTVRKSGVCKIWLHFILR